MSVEAEVVIDFASADTTDAISIKLVIDVEKRLHDYVEATRGCQHYRERQVCPTSEAASVIAQLKARGFTMSFSARLEAAMAEALATESPQHKETNERVDVIEQIAVELGAPDEDDIKEEIAAVIKTYGAARTQRILRESKSICRNSPMLTYLGARRTLVDVFRRCVAALRRTQRVPEVQDILAQALAMEADS